jgi:oligoribonuclease NrnB/cAMP/cGMP phosphodiesterase (DHH superfamily)
MRIVTRPDFDGVVCAALLLEVEQINEPIFWVEPGDMQKGRVEVRPGDIIANLPFHENCSLWFDHHFTNEIKRPYKGLFKEAPSAARIIFEYYRPRLDRFGKLIDATDRIDAAELTLDEVEHPEKYPTVLLSMTISNQNAPDEPYWNSLVEKLRSQSVEKIVNDADVRGKCEAVIEENRNYREQLKKYTRLIDRVAVTDFRSFQKAPTGNRFLVYSMFQEANVHVRIRYDSRDPGRIIVNVGHSIFNRTCNVNVGLLLSRFEGGGHPGAGSCTFDAGLADTYIPQIIQILRDNKPIS